ncbi:uncharacterized protein LOC111335276 [Stylophora pistillata]|uniref:uncharacterized protein LOC111335276 n=1 Tax=Stylophora pistillata TaxID=50429 RepID=UPI000C03E1F2|nr:uncharacterized protein LOC111335276 [Stylophora pistillata]
MKLPFVITFFLCISVGHCLTCYQCISAKSWGDCGSETKKQTCPLGSYACAKFEQKLPSWGGTLYAKGCTDTEQWCKDIKHKDVCQGQSSSNLCSAYCCTGDLCNGGSLPTASTITFLACTFVAFLNSFGSLIKELLL